MWTCKACNKDSSIGNTRSISQIVLATAAMKFVFISDRDREFVNGAHMKRGSSKSRGATPCELATSSRAQSEGTKYSCVAAHTIMMHTRKEKFNKMIQMSENTAR